MQERTTGVVNSLAMEVGAWSLSMDELNEIIEHPLEMNQSVAKIVLECKKDMWSNMEMFHLSNAFFDNSIKTSEFCTVSENCLRRTRNSQLIIKLAVKQFEEDQKGGDEKCVRTFEELKKFEEAGNPFTPEFVQLAQSLYEQHCSTFNKLQIEKRKLDKKSNTMKAWKKASNLIFVTAFVSVVIFSIVAAVKSAPPLVIALAAAQAIPLGPVAKWCNTIWNRHLKRIEKEKQLIISMQRPTFAVTKELEEIRVLVPILSNRFGLLANLCIMEQGAMQLVVNEIKKNLQGFDETIEKLSVHAGECSKKVTNQTTTALLQKIIRHPAAD